MLLGIYNFVCCDPYIFSSIQGTGVTSPHDGYANDMDDLV
jgi:hypothetical protein